MLLTVQRVKIGRMDYSTTKKIVALTSEEPRFEHNSNRRAEGGMRLHGKGKVSCIDNPLISIVTVVFNGVRYLEDTILSVLNQTYDNVEYIIIDGGSTDGTLDIIRKYESAIDYWVSEPDEGIADAFNKGISLCTGDWVGIINADDMYCKNTLELVSKQVSARILCGRLRLIAEDETFELPARPDVLPRMMSVNHPTVFIRKEIYKQFGTFDTSFKIAMDFELMIRLHQQNIHFMVLEDVLAVMRMGGISDKSFRKSLKEVYRAKIKNGLSRNHSLIIYYGQFTRSLVQDFLERIGLSSMVKWYRTHFIKVKREYLK